MANQNDNKQNPAGVPPVGATPMAGQPQQVVGVPPVVATPVSVTPSEHVDRSNDATA